MNKSSLVHLLMLAFVFTFATSAYAQDETIVDDPDLYHKNGKIAYDESFGAVYAANTQQIFLKRMKIVKYQDGKDAYEPRYKNVYYSNGSVAYNNLNKNLYYQDGVMAYSASQHTVYDSKGQVLKQLTYTENHVFTVENLKVTVSNYVKYEFELTIPDDDFIYTTNLVNSFKIAEKASNKLLAEIKY